MNGTDATPTPIALAHWDNVALIGRHGWLTPKLFTTAEDEIAAGTNGAAVCDATMAGRLKIEGRDALDLLQRISTNDLLRTPRVGGMRTLLVTEKGRMVDVIVLCPDGEGFLALTSPGKEPGVAAWIGRFTITEDVRVTSVSGARGMITVMGPLAEGIMTKCAGPELDEKGWSHFDVGGAPFMAVRERRPRRTMYHCVAGGAQLPVLWERLVSEGATPIGWDAAETLRIRHVEPSVPGELITEWNPLELGLRGDISFTKGCYVGQEVIARIDSSGKVMRRLVEFRAATQILDAGTPVVDTAGHTVGLVTSTAPVPIAGGICGLAVVTSNIDAAAEMKTSDGASLSIQL